MLLPVGFNVAFSNAGWSLPTHTDTLLHTHTHTDTVLYTHTHEVHEVVKLVCMITLRLDG